MIQSLADNAHIVFSGGRTGGHLFPGIAVAEHLRRAAPHCRISFCGSGCEFDRAKLTKAGLSYFAIPSAPAPQAVRGVLPFLANSFRGLRQATEFIKRENVSAVVGLGGFSSVPMAWAAARAGRPLVLLEQNIVPGRATRWLASSANVVCLSWSSGKEHLPKAANVRVTGNPIREEFTSARTDRAGRNKRRLVILGGSQGARQLNEVLPSALRRCRNSLTGWEVLHQSGSSDWSATKRAYDLANVQACVVPFVSNVATVLQKTDLVICRSGGTTLAELAAMGMPAILVPLPRSAGDHQRHNAEFFAARCAVAVVDSTGDQESITDELATLIDRLVADHQLRQEMSNAMAGNSHGHAASKVAAIICTLLAPGVWKAA
jgi:UDP-N-acetylglucosamine--N-acetylmuramyl-(pentapeptide) pyrophosphoryl-undecaprenol N-acetylglucosamine transferase